MFIARQPIFDREMNVFGYELLFRSNIKATKFDFFSPTHATANVISNTYEMGLDRIVAGKKAFINFDEEFLKYSLVDILDPECLVVEILEGTSDDNEIIKVIRKLKKDGYKIALDDFVESPSSYSLFPEADIIKIDVLNTPYSVIDEIINVSKLTGKILLAEKIETNEIYEQTKFMGFDLFQGYFFSKPQIIKESSSMHSSYKQYARIFNELEKEEPSYQLLAEIIERDLNISYKVLRHIKNKSSYNIDDVKSIKKALTYIGLKDLSKWIAVLMIQHLSDDKSIEILRTSLIRSHFAEMIAQNTMWRDNQYEALMMGLLSVLDIVLGMTMEDALRELPLSKAVKDALLDRMGVLEPIYLLVLTYESGDWNRVNRLCKLFRIDPTLVTKYYLKSVELADKTIVNL